MRYHLFVVYRDVVCGASPVAAKVDSEKVGSSWKRTIQYIARFLAIKELIIIMLVA